MDGRRHYAVGITSWRGKKEEEKRTGDTPKKSAAGLLGVVGGALGVVELCATLTNEVCRRAAGLPNRERRLDDGIWRADGKEGKKRGSSFSLLEREREREKKSWSAVLWCSLLIEMGKEESVGKCAVTGAGEE